MRRRGFDRLSRRGGCGDGDFDGGGNFDRLSRRGGCADGDFAWVQHVEQRDKQ